MGEARLPDNEPFRLQNLYSYRILDTEPEEAFEETAALAAQICEAPIALVSMIDDSRQWFKAHVGLDVEETARSVSFCAHAILQNDLFIVPDTLQDPRFSANPFVTGPPYIRFYAGAPLHTDEGFNLGTLCVVDVKPRDLTDTQLKALSVLRRHVLTLLNLRRQKLELRVLNSELEAFNAAVSRDLVAPARRISGFCQILTEDHAAGLGDAGQEIVRRINNAAVNTKEMVDSLLQLFNITRTELRFTKINLSVLAEEVMRELHESAPKRHLEYDITPNLFVYSDSRLLRLLLEKFLENAWKFTENNATTIIELGCEEKDGQTVFYVRDNGVGFDMSGAEQLCLPFERLHTEREFQGVGVGLAIVERILQRHGGGIYYQSAPGKGTTFYFTL